MRKNFQCIDVNSKYCPCLLAENNNCVFCSQLQGASVCDCNWAGVCIFYEKHWQDKNVNRPQAVSRQDVETKITASEQLGPNTYLLQFEVPVALANDLTKPGSFVFLRCASDPLYFNFPVGIMKVAGASIQVVIEAIGPKSARLMSNIMSKISVRGPYFNGVFGQPWIDNSEGNQILLVAGGMGQSPVLSIAAQLVDNGNKVAAIIAPGKVGKVFIEQELRNLGVEVLVVNSLRQWGFKLFCDCCMNDDQRPELVVSAGPDEQHYALINAMKTAGVNIPMAATNNARMCCGEGICGSCEKVTYDNKVVRACKVQTDFAQFGAN